MKKKILLIGGGGHCEVVLDLLLAVKEYDVAGIIDVKAKAGEDVFGVPVIGTDRELPVFFKKGIKHCFISVGSIGDAALRVKLYGLARKAGFSFPNLISPAAFVSSRAVIGSGNFIAPGAAVNAASRIGNNCIINTCAVVEHDCRVGDFAHLSPGCVLSGGAEAGERSHIGSGAVVIQGITVGSGAVIGAGSVVTRDIRPDVLAYGNPCRERKRNA